MKSVKKLALILFSLVLFSCSKENPEPTFLEMAAGRWQGTFSGDDNGTWTMTIQNDGKLIGELRSQNVPNIGFPGTGTLTAEGKISATIQVTESISEMTGSISNQKMTGTWKNDTNGIEGIWEGTKVSE